MPLSRKVWKGTLGKGLIDAPISIAASVSEMLDRTSYASDFTASARLKSRMYRIQG